MGKQKRKPSINRNETATTIKCNGNVKQKLSLRHSQMKTMRTNPTVKWDERIVNERDGDRLCCTVLVLLHVEVNNMYAGRTMSKMLARN